MSMVTTQTEEVQALLLGYATESVDTLKDIIKIGKEGIKKIEDYLKKVKDIFHKAGDVVDEIGDFFNEIKDYFNEAEDALNEAENSINEAEGYCDEIKDLLDQIAKLNHEAALLEASTEATKEQAGADKQKFYAATEGQAIITEMQLKPFQQPKQNIMSPWLDEHAKVMLHQAKCNESIEAENKFGALADNIDIPKVRARNARLDMQKRIEKSKLDYLKIHSTCRDDIQKLDMELWYPMLVNMYEMIMTTKVQYTDIRMRCDKLRKFCAECLKAMDDKSRT